MKTVSCLLLALFVLPCAWAAKLPEWARVIAEDAPALEEGLAKHPSRVLLTETLISVQPNGRFKTRERIAVQALRNRSDEVGIGSFQLSNDAEVLTSKAWHLPPEGKVKKSRKDSSMDLTLADLFLTDDMTRFIRIDDIEKGSLVFFEFETVDTPYLLMYMSYFLETAPTVVSRLRLDLPPGWDAEHVWMRKEGPQAVVNGDSRIWELRDLDPLEYKPLGGSPIDDAPLLLIRMIPPPEANVIPAVVSNSESFAEWYKDFTAGMDRVTPAIEAKLSEILSSSEQGFFNTVHRSAKYVRDNVRYVAKEIGEGNIKPRPAGQVMKNLFGDCKDKTYLLRSLLATGDISSYPVLVHATTPDTVSEKIPSLGVCAVGNSTPQSVKMRHVDNIPPLPTQSILPAAAESTGLVA